MAKSVADEMAEFEDFEQQLRQQQPNVGRPDATLQDIAQKGWSDAGNTLRAAGIDKRIAHSRVHFAHINRQSGIAEQSSALFTLPKEQPPIPTRLLTVAGLDPMPMPYFAPPGHPMPSMRADVPSLYDPGEMIPNPLFAVHVESDALDGMEEWITQKEHAVLKGNECRTDLSQLYAACEQWIPEFATQFTPEQIQNLPQAEGETLKQFAYAFRRIVDAHDIEETLNRVTENLYHFINEILLSYIPNEIVIMRVRQAMHTWDAMLRSPYRNYALTLPVQRRERDSPHFDKSRGKALARLGGQHINIDYGSSSNAGQCAGWSGATRRIVYTSQREFSDYEEAIITLHELIHVCQDNDILDIDFNAWEARTENESQFLETLASANLPRECEAFCIEGHLLFGQMLLTRRNYKDFCQMRNVRADFFPPALLEILYSEYRQGKYEHGSRMYSYAFLDVVMRLLMAENRRMFVEKNFGEFAYLPE